MPKRLGGRALVTMGLPGSHVGAVPRGGTWRSSAWFLSAPWLWVCEFALPVHVCLVRPSLVFVCFVLEKIAFAGEKVVMGEGVTDPPRRWVAV